MIRNADGLTIVEVIVAMAILAILGAALVGVLPSLSRNTRASSIDTQLSQVVFSVFETVASSWSNANAFTNETVGDDSIELAQHVSMLTDGNCWTDVTPLPSDTFVTRKRLVITCEADVNLPERSLRAEFGNPGGAAGGE